MTILEDDRSVLADVDDPRLVRAIESNQLAAFRAFARVPGLDFRVELDHTRFISGHQHPFFNQVFAVSFAHEDADRRIAEIHAKFAARRVPLLWTTGPSTQPADLPERLARAGFELDPLPGMAVEIARVPVTPVPPELRIVRADREDRMLDFCRASVVGFEGRENEERAQQWMPFYAALPRDAMACYLGLVDGAPVATAMAYRDHGVVGLYSIATVAAARGRGYGAAMTVAPLRDAYDDGLRVAILHASAMGRPVYERLGFPEFCRVHMNVWKPQQA